MFNFGELLKNLREDKGISMDKMIDDIKKIYNISIAKSTISKWENNKAEPTMENARILSSYFNVSLDYLLGLTDENGNENIDRKIKFVEGSVDLLLKNFLDSGIITDIDNMDKDTEDMILSLVKRELKKIKKENEQ